MHLRLPELGEGVHEGELLNWKVKVGDIVTEDQPVCEIMTDKATVELPAPFHGKVTELLAKEGSVVKVGQEMLAYEPNAGAATGKEPKKSALANAPAPQASVPMSASPAAIPYAASSASGSGLAVAAAPSTRKFAREAGVDLSRIPGTGPAGRILREDIERVLGGGTGAVSGGTPSIAPMVLRQTPRTSITAGAPGSEERIPMRGLRKKIAEKMRQSKDHAAHFTYVEEADATALVQLRNQSKEVAAKYGIKITYLPFVMKAMCAALKKYPILNSSLDEEKQEIVVKKYVNIALSVQTEDGLMAPVIKDVPNKTILELAKEIQEIVERARSKKLTMDDLQGSTLTLTNAGSIGGVFATPVINYPEVAIVGFNKIARKPVVVNTNGREEIVIRDWTYFSISLDHRVIDGAIGAEYMKEMIRHIENPALLLLDTNGS